MFIARPVISDQSRIEFATSCAVCSRGGPAGGGIYDDGIWHFSRGKKPPSSPQPFRSSYVDFTCLAANQKVLPALNAKSLSNGPGAMPAQTG